MGILQHLGIADDEGKTLPPASRIKEIPSASVHHLKKFEDIATDIVQTKQSLDNNIYDMAELERTTVEARDAITQEREQLTFRLNTLKDQLKQHIESLPVDAQITFQSPTPPDPKELDVKFESAQAREESE